MDLKKIPKFIRMLSKIIKGTKLDFFLDFLSKEFMFNLIDNSYFKYYNGNYHLFFYFKKTKAKLKDVY